MIIEGRGVPILQVLGKFTPKSDDGTRAWCDIGTSGLKELGIAKGYVSGDVRVIYFDEHRKLGVQPWWVTVTLNDYLCYFKRSDFYIVHPDESYIGHATAQSAMEFAENATAIMLTERPPWEPDDEGDEA